MKYQTFSFLVIFNLATVLGAVLKEHPLSDSFINKINSLQNSWKAGRNFDVNSSPNQLKSLLGVKSGYKTKLPLRNVGILEDLPENFDARDKWSNCRTIMEVRDQSTCGSCWAFAAVEAMSDRICIHSNETLQVSLSANDLLACCAACGNGCDGGEPDEAWLYWTTKGIVSGGGYGTNDGCQAYVFPECEHHTTGSRKACGEVQPTPTCTRKCDSSSGLNYNNELYFGKSAYSVSMDEAMIRSEIYQNGPVEASLAVYEDFLSYKSGVYKYTAGDLAGFHAVKILGWGVENNLPYWLIANSWNNDWGDKGFIRMLRGSNECGIEDSIVAGIAK